MQRVEVTSLDGVPLEAAVDPSAGPVRRGVVVLVHGITVDMNEGGGMFPRLAQQLAAVGFDVVGSRSVGTVEAGERSSEVPGLTECHRLDGLDDH